MYVWAEPSGICSSYFSIYYYTHTSSNSKQFGYELVYRIHRHMLNMEFRNSIDREVPCHVWSNGQWASSDCSPIAWRPQSWCCVPSSREYHDARPSYRVDTNSCGARVDRHASGAAAISGALCRRACAVATRPGICSCDPSRRPPDRCHRRKHHRPVHWCCQYPPPPATAPHSRKPTDLWKLRISGHNSAGRPWGKPA